MQLPFSKEQFFSVFAQYNAGVWPLQIFLYGPAIAILVALRFKSRTAARIVLLMLSLLWLWMAFAYHLRYFAAINPAARLFAGLFILETILLLVASAAKDPARLVWSASVRGWIGAAFIFYGLVLYPILGYLAGHRWPAAPGFGLPCPTTIFTIGVLSLGQTAVQKWLLVLPILWSLIGSVAAFQLGVPQDLALVVAAVWGMVLLLIKL